MNSQYAAGLFDGEGCVRVARHTDTGGYSLTVKITGAYRPTIVALKQAWGGSTGSYSPIGGHKRAHQWSAGGPVADAFLAAVQPHLREKEEEVFIARAWFADRQMEPRLGYDWSRAEWVDGLLSNMKRRSWEN